MIKSFTRLSEQDKDALERLMTACLAADGLPVTVHTDKVLNRFQDMKNWFLAYEGSALAGVVSVFGPLATEAELTGCVHPEYRRRGIFTALAAAALAETQAYGIERLMFALNRASVSGQALMRKRGCPLAHTEYSMVFPVDGEVRPTAPRLHIMRTGIGELDAMAQISAAAFEEPLDAARSFLANGLKTPEREQYGAWFGDRMVGTLSVLIVEETAMLNGLAVAPQEQGKGYGADFLTQMLRMLHRRGLQACLDVNSENHGAYRLYKRLGFVETNVQDYFLWTHGE